MMELTELNWTRTLPIGESYRAFQKYVLALKERGVILAVYS